MMLSVYLVLHRFWRLKTRLLKKHRFMFLTIYFLLIQIAQIRQSWNILRFFSTSGLQFHGSFTWPFDILKLLCWKLNLQIQATVFALRNTRGLPWPKDHKKKKDEDILDWLQAMFGFQVMWTILSHDSLWWIFLLSMGVQFRNSMYMTYLCSLYYRETTWQIKENIWSYCWQMCI